MMKIRMKLIRVCMYFNAVLSGYSFLKAFLYRKTTLFDFLGLIFFNTWFTDFFSKVQFAWPKNTRVYIYTGANNTPRFKLTLE